MQVRTIRASLDELAKTFDAEVSALFTSRLAADRLAREFDLRSASAATAAERLMGFSSAAVSAAMSALAPSQLHEQTLKGLLLLLQDRLKSAAAAAEDAAAAERAADRSFKRDFADACLEAAPVLAALAKRAVATKGPSAAAAARAAAAAADPFPMGFTHKDMLPAAARRPPGGRPVEVEESMWQLFVQWWDARASAEDSAAAAAAEHGNLKALVEELQAKHAACVTLQRICFVHAGNVV
jgi:hypothetical protein